MEEHALVVRLGQPRHGRPKDSASCPPIIDVFIACDTDPTTETTYWPDHNGVQYAALLDTGADLTAIDEQLAREIGITPYRQSVLHGLDVSNKEVGVARVHIILPVQDVVFSDDAYFTSLRATGHSFDIILGRTFLRHCRFSVDGPRNEYSLTWVR